LLNQRFPTTEDDSKDKKSGRVDIRAMLVRLTLPLKMIFAVFDPTRLTVCINCSFFTFITLISDNSDDDWHNSRKDKCGVHELDLRG